MKKFLIFINVFLLNAMMCYATDLTCVELKYTVSSQNHSVEKIEYFYLDYENKVVLDKSKNSLKSVFEDNFIKFETVYPANDKSYNIMTEYTIDRYTGSLMTIHASVPRSVLGKIERAMFVGIQSVTIGEGTGTVKKVDKIQQLF